MPKKICSNGNRRPIRYENWNGTTAIWYDGNIVLNTNGLNIFTIILNNISKILSLKNKQVKHMVDSTKAKIVKPT